MDPIKRARELVNSWVNNGSIISQARNSINGLQNSASNALSNLVPTSTYYTDYRVTPTPTQNPKIIGNPSQMKLTVNRPIQQSSPIAQPIQQSSFNPSQQSNQWQSKYQPIYDKVLPKKKLTKQDVQILVTSENGREDPGFQNTNYDKFGKPKSVDTGLLQINTPIHAKEEIQKLKDPTYNIEKGLEILHQRNQVLGDPVLAIAAYNKGARGAVLNPKDALNRARVIYKNAGIPLPQTPFTQDPMGFVKQNRDRYISMGVLLQGD